MLCVCFEKQTVLLDLTAKVAAFDLWTLTFSIAFYWMLWAIFKCIHFCG